MNADFPMNIRFTIMLEDSETGQLINGFGGTADELQGATYTIDGNVSISGVIGVNTATQQIQNPSYNVQPVVGAYPNNVKHFILSIY